MVFSEAEVVVFPTSNAFADDDVVQHRNADDFACIAEHFRDANVIRRGDDIPAGMVVADDDGRAGFAYGIAEDLTRMHQALVNKPNRNLLAAYQAHLAVQQQDIKVLLVGSKKQTVHVIRYELGRVHLWAKGQLAVHQPLDQGQRRI